MYDIIVISVVLIYIENKTVNDNAYYKDLITVQIYKQTNCKKHENINKSGIINKERNLYLHLDGIKNPKTLYVHTICVK